MTPTWVLNYASTGVTSELGPMVTSVAYTDHLHGQSDECELQVEDSQDLWRTGWFPDSNDRIELEIGYEGEELLPCGEFAVDEVELAGDPKRCVIRALAAGSSAPHRTKRTRTFEGQTYSSIVNLIAQESGLTPVGTPSETKEPLKSVQQKDETNLEFLKRLGEETGNCFNVRGTQLIFFRLEDLETAEPVATIELSQLKPGYRFTSGTQGTYVACEVSYDDPDTGELIVGRVTVENLRERKAESSPESVEVPQDVLRQGDTKPLVGEWQTFLSARGQYDYVIDDIFGPITFRGTRLFQQEQGIAVDGVVGPETWGAAIAAGFRSAESIDSGVAGDVLYVNRRVESVEHAELLAASLLHKANRLKAKGEFEVLGNTVLVSGVVIEMVGLQRMSGRYMVEESKHRIQKGGGYNTEVQVTYVAA